MDCFVIFYAVGESASHSCRSRHQQNLIHQLFFKSFNIRFIRPKGRSKILRNIELKTGMAIFNFYKTHEGVEHRNPKNIRDCP